MTAWSDMSKAQKMEAVKPLVAEGRTYTEMAAILGATSRNAIAGAVSNLRLAGGHKPHRRRDQAEKQPKQPKPSTRLAAVPGGAIKTSQYNFAARIEQRKASPGLTPAQIAGEPYRPVAVVAPVSLRIGLLDLSDSVCRFPHGDPHAADFHFCGADTCGTPPYCRFHSNLAFVAPPSRKARHDPHS